MSGPVSLLRELILRGETPEYDLLVADPTTPDPVGRLLDRTFSTGPVAVDDAAAANRTGTGTGTGIEEGDGDGREHGGGDEPGDGDATRPAVDGDAEDVVMLVRGDEVVASSPLRTMMDACLLVNADRYRTGTVGIDEATAPAVLTRLDEAVFELRGYPESNREKLLLVVVSRFIERRALAAGEGRLRSTFQRLGRVTGEPGTREVYRRLAGTDLDVHLYGLPGDEPPAEWNATVHAGTHEGYRRAWCVVHVPPAPGDDHAALIALETGPNEWLGTWTYDRERVRRVDRVLDETF